MGETAIVPKELLVTSYNDVVTPRSEIGSYELKEGEYDRLFPKLPEVLQTFIRDNNVDVEKLPDYMIIGVSIVDTDIYTMKLLRNYINNDKRINDFNKKTLTKNVFDLMVQSMLDNHDSYHPATYLDEEFD